MADLLRIGPSKDCSLLGSVARQFRTVARIKTLVRRIKQRKLEILLGKLTDAGILSTERRRGAAWYEFRHDYLVGQVSSWVNGVEQRLVRRRWIWGLALAALLTILVWLGKVAIDFNTYVVSFCPHRAYAHQQEELRITRKLNPFGYSVSTGLLKADLLTSTSSNLVHKDLVLSGGCTDWDSLAELLRDEKSATFLHRVKTRTTPVETWLLSESPPVILAQARTDPSLRTTLLKALESTKDDGSAVRRRAAVILSELGCAEPAVVTAMVEALKDRDPSVRAFSAEALGTLANGSPTAVVALVELLKDRDFDVHRSATAALVQLGRVDPAVEMTLFEALRDNDSDVRFGAAEALGRLGREEPAVIMALVEDLENGELRVKIRAEEALERSAPVMVAALRAALKDVSGDVQVRAIEALGRLNRTTPEMVDAMLYALREGELPTRYGTAQRSEGLAGE